MRGGGAIVAPFTAASYSDQLLSWFRQRRFGDTSICIRGRGSKRRRACPRSSFFLFLFVFYLFIIFLPSFLLYFYPLLSFRLVYLLLFYFSFFLISFLSRTNDYLFLNCACPPSIQLLLRFRTVPRTTTSTTTTTTRPDHH